MKYYLGIDGGGTFTTFLLVNNQGKIISKYKTTTCHYEQIGLSGFQSVIAKGLEVILSKAQIKKQDLKGVFAAIPGYGESEEAKISMRQLLGVIFNGIVWDCGNDVLAGFAGSLALKPGINILAGTGSMVYGQIANTKARSGGWGHICGDEGSAYWLGRKLLETYTKQADGRLPKSYLYQLVKQELKLSYDFELIEVVVNWNGRREKIASLATLVTKAAKQQDSYAIKLYQQAAKELALQARAVINTLKFTNYKTISVSWSGGVFKARDIIFKPLITELKAIDKRCELQSPMMNPERGAVLLAKQLTGAVSSDFINTLKNEEEVR